MKNKFTKLYDALLDVYGHSGNNSVLFRLEQVALVAMGIRDVRLHDDTCDFITSGKFIDDVPIERIVCDECGGVNVHAPNCPNNIINSDSYQYRVDQM